ncbi:lytic transglycosylase domain-containing protein [Rhodospirillales bacterium]|nr:lytic transglycosylase domain-containing protein [Rhodospirillales bacterium]
MKRSKVLCLIVVILTGLTGCESINPEGSEYQKTRISLNGVNQFNTPNSSSSRMPRCIAVLPFTSEGDIPDILLTTLRESVAGKISPLDFRDVELRFVDTLLSQMNADETSHISEGLNCDGIMYGEVTSHNRVYVGVFSHLSITAKLRLVNVQHGEIAWMSKQTSGRNGGGVPLSISGAITGALSAIINASDDTQLSVIDDLSRSLVATLPSPTPGLYLAEKATEQSRQIRSFSGGEQGSAKFTNASYENATPVAARLSGNRGYSAKSRNVSKTDVQALIVEEAQKVHGMPPSLALALARVESNFNARAESNKGARGIMQIMPLTSSRSLNIHPDRLWDPVVNVRAGLSFLKSLYVRYGNRWELALSHYNGGSLKRINGRFVPHTYTRNYYNKVMKWQAHYAQKLRETKHLRFAKRSIQRQEIALNTRNSSSRQVTRTLHKPRPPALKTTTSLFVPTQVSPYLLAEMNATAQRTGLILRNRAW